MGPYGPKWHCHIIEVDRLMRFQRILFYQVLGDHTFRIIKGFSEGGMPVEEVVELPEYADLDPGGGILIPYGGLDAIVETMNPPVDRQAEIDRLEEALKLEQERVTKLLDAAIQRVL